MLYMLTFLIMLVLIMKMATQLLLLTKVKNLEQANNLLVGVVKNTTEVENWKLKTKFTKLAELTKRFSDYHLEESGVIGDIVDPDDFLGVDYQFQSNLI